MKNTNDKLPEFNANEFFGGMDNFLSSIETTTTETPKQETQPEQTQDEKPDYDFKVLRLNNFVTMPNGNRHSVPRLQSLFNNDNGNYLGSCSPSYNLVKHSHAVELLKEAANRTGLEYSESHTTTKDGARLFYNIRFDGAGNKIDGEKIAPQIVMINTYDGSAPFDVDLGAYRFVCSNGMRVGKSLQRTRIKHTTNLDIEDIVQKIELKLNSYTKVFIPFCNALAKYDATQKEGVGIIEGIAKKSIFPERHTKKVIEEWKAPRNAIRGGQNAWGIYNAFTSIITHDIQPNSFERGHQLSGQIMTGFESLVSC